MRHKVFASLLGPVERVHLAQLHVGGPSGAVIGLAAMYRREVAVVSARHLAGILAPLGRPVDAFGLCAIPSAPSRRCLLVQ